MRPSESITAAVSTIVGATLLIVQAFWPEVAAKITYGVQNAIIILLGYVAMLVTYLVTRRLNDPNSPLVSRADGSVTTSAP